MVGVDETTVFTDGAAVMESSEGAEEEAEGREEEDERGFPFAPSVAGVDEREGDGEEVEECGAEGVGEG